jgi:AraC-like DNA-binding protein
MSSLPAETDGGLLPGTPHRLSTDRVPPTERFAFWKDVVCRDTYRVTPGPCPDPDRFDARIEIRDCGRFGFAEVESVETTRERTPSDIAQDGADHVVVYRVGRSAFVSDGKTGEHQLSPGDMCVLSVARRFEIRARDGLAFRSLIIPQGVVSPLVTAGRVPGLCVVEGTSGIGVLLGGALDLAWSEMPRFRSDFGDGVLENVSRLVALALDGSAATRETADAVRAARLATVKRHIEMHLHDAGLTPAKVAAALCFSPRQLHMLFEREALSFARYLTDRRLNACLAALQSPSAAHRSVADIAFGFGFSSMATFYRAFQAAFGVAPASLRPR